MDGIPPIVLSLSGRLRRMLAAFVADESNRIQETIDRMVLVNLLMFVIAEVDAVYSFSVVVVTRLMSTHGMEA